jgi:hypothetical protein
MPYADGRSPTIGDRGKNTTTGKIETVINIVLGVPSMQGRDQLTVKWDDGGFVAVSLLQTNTNSLKSCCKIQEIGS